MFAKGVFTRFGWLGGALLALTGCASPNTGRRPEVMAFKPPPGESARAPASEDLYIEEAKADATDADAFWHQERSAAPRRVKWRPPPRPRTYSDLESVYFPSAEEGWDAGDLLARVRGTLVAGISGDTEAAYRHFLELPEETPETRIRVGYRGEIPGVDARKALQEIAGEVFTDKTGVFGGGKWVVGSWAVSLNPLTRHGPIVPLWRPGTEKEIPRTPSSDVFILPILTDGDAADLYKRVTGGEPMGVSGEMSLRYKSVWRRQVKRSQPAAAKKDGKP